VGVGVGGAEAGGEQGELAALHRQAVSAGGAGAPAVWAGGSPPQPLQPPQPPQPPPQPAHKRQKLQQEPQELAQGCPQAVQAVLTRGSSLGGRCVLARCTPVAQSRVHSRSRIL
jgi:hypothetical protein